MSLHSNIEGVHSRKETSPVKTLVKFLNKVYLAVGDYIEDDKNSAKCLYFQDSSMKDMFNFYPDRICIDRTFKKFEIDLFTFTFLCEDSNGRNCIIAVGFLQYNDAESLIWLLNVFKKHNPNWKKIKSLVLDPDINMELLKNLLPTPVIVTCFYHALASFKSFIESSDQFRTFAKEQKNCAIDLFQKLFCATRLSEFELYYQQYLTLSVPFVSYLHDIWMPKQHHWKIPLDYIHENLFLNLNLYLEELKNAIYQLCLAEINYIEFIKKLFLLISLKKKEKPGMFLQPVSFLYSKFSPEYQISKALTPYAAKFVIEQLDLSSEMRIDINALSETYAFDYLGMLVSATATTCTCNFYLFTLLPCRHIFAVRRINYLCMFDESHVDYTWNMKYYQHASACLRDYLVHSTDSRIPQDLSSRAIISSHLFEIAVPSLIELPDNVYQSRIQLLKQLLETWKRDEVASIQFIGTEKPEACDSDSLKLKNLPKENVAVPSELEVNSSTENCFKDTPNQHETYSQSQELSASDSPSCSNMITSNLLQRISPSNSSQCRSYELEEIPSQVLRNFNTNILNGRHINLAYVLLVICPTKQSCVNWLKKQGFLQPPEGNMTNKNVIQYNDGAAKCLKQEVRKCFRNRSVVKSGTWFEGCDLTLEEILIFTYMWLNKYTKAYIIFEIGITAADYVKWDKNHRRVCEASMRNDVLMEDQVNKPSNKDSLTEWLQKHAGEDTFLQFLKDAAHCYEKDKVHNVLDSKSK